MKTQRFTLFLTASLLAICGATPTYAQTSQKAKATIPFNFMVGNAPLPAGEYTLGTPSNSQGVLLIRNSENGASVFVLTESVHAKAMPEKGKLIFNRYGNQYFLSQLWNAEENRGLKLVPSRLEREIAKSTSDRKVATSSKSGTQTATVAIRKP